MFGRTLAFFALALAILLLSPEMGALPLFDEEIFMDGIPETEVRTEEGVGPGFTPSTEGFIENRGQWDDDVVFIGSTSSGPVQIIRNGFGLLTSTGSDPWTYLCYEFADGSETTPSRYHRASTQ